jgi:hypothetical protein
LNEFDYRTQYPKTEINEQMEIARYWRDSSLSAEAIAERAQYTADNNLSNEPIFNHQNSQVINFSVRNNTCVVEEVLTEVLTEPNPTGRTFLSPTLNTELCREIHQFFENNPQAEACFNQRLNDNVDGIFSRYRGVYTGEEYSPGDLGGMMVYGYGSSSMTGGNVRTGANGQFYGLSSISLLSYEPEHATIWHISCHKCQPTQGNML